MQLDVVARRVRDVEADCLFNHEGSRFRFELTVSRQKIIAVVKQFVRLCSDAHTRTYVQPAVMFREAGWSGSRQLR